jgi:protein-S-isoprenylcysteine O-methyltransferase Ste14
MDSNAPFRLVLALLVLGVAAVRIPHHIDAFEAAGTEQFESWNNAALRGGAGILGFAALIGWLISPRWMGWAAIPMPDWLRWFGAGVGFAGLAGLVWVHRELGRNFSGTLALRAGQTLVTSGPYRWVRHPMYTTLYMIVLSFFLVTANWFIGATFIGSLTAVVASRVTREEAVMATRFGDDYRRWAARTGRFLPGL